MMLFVYCYSASFEQHSLGTECVFEFIILSFNGLFFGCFRKVIRTSTFIVDGGLFGGLEHIV